MEEKDQILQYFSVIDVEVLVNRAKKILQTLVDSGTSISIIHVLGCDDAMLQKLSLLIRSSTKGGRFETKFFTLLLFKIIDFSTSHTCNLPVHADDRSEHVGFVFIMGMEAITRLGMVING